MASRNISADQSWPEPNPDWENISVTLGWFWPCHVYFFAVLFLLLALASSVALFQTRSLHEKRLMSTTMIAAVFFLACCRSMFLFVDPYLSSKSTSLLWIVFCLLMAGLSTTCLTASLAILLYITSVSANITHVGHQVHFKRIVFGVTICNFVYVVTSDLVVVFVPGADIMLTICQMTFATWGLFISVGFAVLTWRIRTNAQASCEQASFNLQMRDEYEKLRRLSFFLGVLSVGGGSFFALKVNEAFSGIKAKEFSDSWSWLGLQSVLRSLEIINAVVLLLVFKRRICTAGRVRETVQEVNEEEIQETNCG